MTDGFLGAADVPGCGPGLFQAFDEAPASYLRLAKQLEFLTRARGSRRELRVAMMSTFTIELLSPYLVVEGARRGLAIRPWVAPFGQIEQQVLDPRSPLYVSDPEVIVLALRVEDAAPALGYTFLAQSPAAIEQSIAEFAVRTERLLRAIRERSNACVLIWNHAPPRWVAAGLADTSLEVSQTDAVLELNRRIAAVCRGVPGAWVFDLSRVAAEVGLTAWDDIKLSFLARAPLSAKAQIAVAKRLARTFHALVTPCRKCLVLDLDDTLWGGVLGEDGASGIRLGEDYPGNVYKNFQRTLLSYRDRGILLAIASKNNESDVLDVLDHHPDVVLRREHFAAVQIHWNDKATSLAAIARELRIGTDALVFFDDSAAERAWVRSQMPDVHVVDVPPDPLGYVAALESAAVFDTIALTREDRNRAIDYKAARSRVPPQGDLVSVEEFLRSLAMKIHIGTIDDASIARAVQLISKTNQFNVTTKRRTQPEVERMIQDGAIALSARLSDRHGDSGVIGVALAPQESPDAFVIDTFLLSCRALGRKVETAILAAVAGRARERGATWLIGTFIPSPKNAPAATVFPDHGFEPAAGQPNRWRLRLADGVPSLPDFYGVVDES